ncbi:hypothetical protein AALP_AA6G317000 [Arabis alpina]|uniref:Transmembrane protein n=1 Tax=Arabis alpina TaxID=50452 RepID=A0A087GSZ9_ARAAL|nr:hypothetical protein AALP_AA6G317000 [Arabis alpina]
MDHDAFETSDHGWTKVVHRKQKPTKIDESNLKPEQTINKTKMQKQVSLAEEIESESDNKEESSLAEAASEINLSHLAAFIAGSLDKERVEAIDPSLKKLVQHDPPESKAMKLYTQHILNNSLKVAEQGNRVLAREATSVAFWCLTTYVDCCNHWDTVYNENPQANVYLLSKLAFHWDVFSLSLLWSSSAIAILTLYRTIKSFMRKNQIHITQGEEANASLYKEADMYCNVLKRRLSRVLSYMKPDAVTDSESESENDEAATESEEESESENEEAATETGFDEQAVTESESESENGEELSVAVAKIHPSHLASLLKTSFGWFAGSELYELGHFFERILSAVSSAQFPWPKFDKLIDVIDVLAHIHPSVYVMAAKWINKLPPDRVCSFLLWSFDFIGPRESGKRTPATCYVSLCVTLAIILRSQPSKFSKILPRLRMEPYQAEETLPLTVWMIAQVSQVDLCLGLYRWAHNLLPLVDSNQFRSPQSMDLILQLVESILSYPNARAILVNESVKKGDARLISHSSFEILMRLTFPASSNITKDTKRFEEIYPLLKELSLADAPGRRGTKQLTQQIFTCSLKLAGEGNSVLAKEATSIALWCVTKNVDCCNHWDKVYKKNLEASVALLKKLYEWKDHSLKLLSSSDTLTFNRTMKSFMLKNKKYITEGEANASLCKEADKYCKEILKRLNKSGFLKGISISTVLVATAVAAAPVILLSNLVSSFEPHEYINAITTALTK